MFDNDEFDRWMAQASDTLNSAQEALDCVEKISNFCITMRKKYE